MMPAEVSMKSDQEKDRQFFTALLVLEGQRFTQYWLEKTLCGMTLKLGLDPIIHLHDGIQDLMKDGLQEGWIKLVDKKLGHFVVDARNHPPFRALIASDSPKVQAAIDREIDAKLKEASAKHAAEPSTQALLKQLNDPKAIAPMEKDLDTKARKKKAEERKKRRKPKKFPLDIKVKASQINPRALHPG